MTFVDFFIRREGQPVKSLLNILLMSVQGIGNLEDKCVRSCHWLGTTASTGKRRIMMIDDAAHFFNHVVFNFSTTIKIVWSWIQVLRFPKTHLLTQSKKCHVNTICEFQFVGKIFNFSKPGDIRYLVRKILQMDRKKWMKMVKTRFYLVWNAILVSSTLLLVTAEDVRFFAKINYNLKLKDVIWTS